MPQKSRTQKERAATRRDSGQMRRPVAPAPIELEASTKDSGVQLKMPSTPARRAAALLTALPHSAEADFNYSYVYSDLRRIALLAALCFGIMLVLAFVIKA
jgi:hypothetical protein